MADSALRITDGQVDFSFGVDSGRMPSIASAGNPEGLPRNALAWLENGTVRGGGIYPRSGYEQVASEFSGDTGLFQGGIMYHPLGDVPYMVVAISGVIYRINVWTDGAVSVLNAGFPMPSNQLKYYFLQAEEFLIIQAGDFTTNPLWWTGSAMTQSSGILANQMPPGAAMDYYMGRIWVQVGAREYSAGDIIYGPSGTPAYGGRDSILHWTENTYLAGGGVFNVPSNAGSIRAICHPANMDTALGQGPLIVMARDAIYALEVPVTRNDWVAATGNNLPVQRVVQNRYGTTSDRSVVAHNSDLFYKAYDGVRSLQWALRYFHQWGQTPISLNEYRVLALENRGLSSFASAIVFDNRLLQTVLPFQTTVGVAYQGIVALDFHLLTSLQEKKPPAWEGMLEGLDYMQIMEAESGGLQRAFTVAHSQETGKIQVWEMTQAARTDFGDKRVKWYIEFPAYDWGTPQKLKQLDAAEIFVDNLTGTVDFTAYYRPDNGCWIKWAAWRKCSARTACEDAVNPVCYPVHEYCPGYAHMVLPRPPLECAQQADRQSNIAYQFQFKLEIKGWCRVRGPMILHAFPKMDTPYNDIIC